MVRMEPRRRMPNNPNLSTAIRRCVPVLWRLLCGANEDYIVASSAGVADAEGHAAGGERGILPRPWNVPATALALRFSTMVETLPIAGSAPVQLTVSLPASCTLFPARMRPMEVPEPV